MGQGFKVLCSGSVRFCRCTSEVVTETTLGLILCLAPSGSVAADIGTAVRTGGNRTHNAQLPLRTDCTWNLTHAHTQRQCSPVCGMYMVQAIATLGLCTCNVRECYVADLPGPWHCVVLRDANSARAFGRS